MSFNHSQVIAESETPRSIPARTIEKADATMTEPHKLSDEALRAATTRFWLEHNYFRGLEARNRVRETIPVNDRNGSEFDTPIMTPDIDQSTLSHDCCDFKEDVNMLSRILTSRIEVLSAEFKETKMAINTLITESRETKKAVDRAVARQQGINLPKSDQEVELAIVQWVFGSLVTVMLGLAFCIRY